MCLETWHGLLALPWKAREAQGLRLLNLECLAVTATGGDRLALRLRSYSLGRTCLPAEN
jgi:hypothetical protein